VTLSELGTTAITEQHSSWRVKLAKGRTGQFDRELTRAGSDTDSRDSDEVILSPHVWGAVESSRQPHGDQRKRKQFVAGKMLPPVLKSSSSYKKDKFDKLWRKLT
jgi:hypothetical protein